MKTLKIAKYQISEAKKALMVYYLIIIAIAFMMSVFMIRLGSGTENVSFGGLDFASVIFIFVFGITSFSDNFKFMQANNITRKHFFQGFVIGIFPITAFMAALDILINRITNIFLGISNSLFAQIYLRQGNLAWVNLNIINIINSFIWSFAVLSFFAMLGYFISLVYYRSNIITKIAVSVSPLIIVSVLGYLNGITNGAVSNIVTDFFRLIGGFKHGYNPYIAVLTMSVAFIIFGLFSFLLIRKASVKE